MRIKNKTMGMRIIHTQITPNIRVSTAAIYYEQTYYVRPYWRFETWCFSKDDRQRSFQVIHGTDSNKFSWYDLRTSIKVHQYIAKNLKKKFAKA